MRRKQIEFMLMELLNDITTTETTKGRVYSSSNLKKI
jgi:hypothetical protein